MLTLEVCLGLSNIYHDTCLQKLLMIMSVDCLKGSNFSRVLNFEGRKKLHFAGTNFRECPFTKRFAVIFFANLDFFVVDCLQKVVGDGLG